METLEVTHERLILDVYEKSLLINAIKCRYIWNEDTANTNILWFSNKNRNYGNREDPNNTVKWYSHWISTTDGQTTVYYTTRHINFHQSTVAYSWHYSLQVDITTLVESKHILQQPRPRHQPNWQHSVLWWYVFLITVLVMKIVRTSVTQLSV
jgi:hypothetical protein